MIWLHIFFYYTFMCSAVLFFGIGINRSIQVTTGSLRVNFKVFLKSLISIIATTTLTFLITQYLLIPLGLQELFPVIALLIFLCLNSFIEALVRITAKTSTSEFSISFLITILSIYEGSSLLESLIISASCMLSFLIMLPLVYSFQKRMFIATHDKKEKLQMLVFVSIAVLMLVLSVFDVSWLSLKGR